MRETPDRPSGVISKCPASAGQASLPLVGGNEGGGSHAHRPILSPPLISPPYSSRCPRQSPVMTSDARGDSRGGRSLPRAEETRQPGLQYWYRLNRIRRKSRHGGEAIASKLKLDRGKRLATIALLETAARRRFRTSGPRRKAKPRPACPPSLRTGSPYPQSAGAAIPDRPSCRHPCRKSWRRSPGWRR